MELNDVFIAENPRETIPIGRQGNKMIKTVVFPIVQKYKELFPDGAFSLYVIPPGKDIGYPALITVDEDNVYWTVNDSDLTEDGYGQLQLTYASDEQRKKSCIYVTHICESIGTEETTPPQYQSWVDDVMSAGNDAKQAAEEAEASAQTALIAKEDAEDAAEEAKAQAEYAKGIMGLAIFEIDIVSGELYVTYPTPYYGATFAINNDGMLEVITNE